MRTTAFLIASLVLFAVPSKAQSSIPPAWYEGPQLFVMTGYIANTSGGTWGADFIGSGPWTREKQLADLERWNKGLGKSYDPDAVARSFKEAGATGVIFYDKWHDGLVPHKTRYTNYMTERDLVGDTLRALKKHGLKTVVYYSVGLDANPEPKFKDWTCIDPEGKPMGRAFPEDWKSFYSPYRQYVIDHLVEILQKYGPFEGFYLDLYTQPNPVSRDRYTAKAFQAVYGKPVEQATAEESVNFVTKTLADYLQDIRKAITAVQPNIHFTFNGSGRVDAVMPHRARGVDGQSDWFSIEGHNRATIDSIATVGQSWNRPFETGILLNTSWYVPMSDQAPRASMSEQEAVVSAASVFLRGGNVFAAMTPGHSGAFDAQGGDLHLLQVVGGWLRDNREWIRGSEPFAEIGILRGDAASDVISIPPASGLWHRKNRNAAGPAGSSPPGSEMDLRLRQLGYLTALTGSTFAKRPTNLAQYRLVVLPENAPLSDELVNQIREYVRGGGSLLAFGHASLFDQHAHPRENFALSDVYGVDRKGYLPGYKTLRLMPDSGLLTTLLGNPSALDVAAGTAQVMARWEFAGDRPAIVANRFGKGRVIYVTADELAIAASAELLGELTTRLAGLPAIHVKGRRDYSLAVNRKGTDLILYLVNNSTGSRTNLGGNTTTAVRPSALATTPEEVELTLNVPALGGLTEACLVPSGELIRFSTAGGAARAYLSASPAVTTIRLAR